MELAEHADRPELTVSIGGEEYSFGEILIDDQADLEQWIKRHCPHPLEELKKHLEGLPVAVAIGLAENARQEAKDWPPRIGTAAGSQALLSTESGQIEALRVGLQKFHPGTTAKESARLYRQLTKDALKRARAAKDGAIRDEGTVKRIFSVMFGLGDPSLEDEGPKAQRVSGQHEPSNGYPGTPSTAGVNGS